MHEQYIASLIHILLPNSPHRTKPHTVRRAVFPHGLLLWPLSARSGASPSLLSLSLCVCRQHVPLRRRSPFARRRRATGLRACGPAPVAQFIERRVQRAHLAANAAPCMQVKSVKSSQVKSSQVNSSVTEMKVGQPAQVCSFLTVRAERRSCARATSAERDWDPWNDGWRVLP